MKMTSRIATVLAVLSLGAPLAAPTAFAGDKGKSSGGCSSPYTLMSYDETGNLSGDPTLQQRNAELLAPTGPFTATELFDLFRSIDHNGNGSLCVKLPDGWTSGNTDNKAGFLNLVDDKLVS